MKKINLITKRDIALYKRIEADCLRAHLVPPTNTFIGIKVDSADGTPVLEMKMLSKSYVRNFYNIIGGQGLAVGGTGTYGAGAFVVKGITGTSFGQAGPHYSSSVTNFVGTAGTANKGIAVGSGTTAESFEHTALATQIAHGTSAGQLSYAAQSATSWSYNSGTKKITAVYERVFNNTSGGDVTVNEIALIATINTANNIMLSRDLLAESVVVGNNQKLTVTYSVDFTYPA